MSDKLTPLEYYELLEKHDWFFEYSDDGRVWREGVSTL